jgi:amino acid adenylation domain-containing protein
MVRRNLADLLDASAARYPDRLAVVESDSRTLTYTELDKQSDALAGFLTRHGVRRGDRVGLALPKGLEAVISLFGIMKAGAAYVPIDIAAPAERSRMILEDCGVSALITIDACRGLISHSTAAVHVIIVDPSPDDAKSVSFARAVENTEAFDPIAVEGNDLAYIIFTSGSTGVPKGAMISHANALSFIDWCSETFAPTADDRVSNHAPFHFDYSVLDIYLTIKHGATVYLISEELAKRPRDMARFIAHHRLTVWSSTPSALMMLVQFGEMESCDASSLRLVTFGGEVFPPKYLRELQRHWTTPAYFNLYGPTEITTACTFARIPSPVPADRESPYPIGFPCSHCATLMLDEHGNEVPEGNEGLLHISGPSVFAGYWNRPEETAAAFAERSGVRWYNTGDVVRWNTSEGFTYVGRVDRMVKRRGFRIELGEIERALYLHAGIREAAVVAVPDPNAGVKIVAYVSCRNDRPSIVDLKTFCATKVPTYMVPDRFVFQDRLPRTSSDKVDYQALRAEMTERA